MQLCTIYKSSKKLETYLFIEKRDVFEKVPEQLMTMFGKPVLVMTLDLDKRDSLAMADLNKVKQQLTDNGYYLQLPPPSENLLEQFRRENGLTD